HRSGSKPRAGPARRAGGGAMKTISVSEAKARLSYWLRRVRGGEAVVIESHGHPVARLVPAAASDRGPDDARVARLEEAGILRRGRGGGARATGCVPSTLGRDRPDSRSARPRDASDRGPSAPSVRRAPIGGRAPCRRGRRRAPRTPLRLPRPPTGGRGGARGS